MPKLVIIRGNSGSGKSTVAKELQRKFGRGTMLIPQDTVRRDMLRAKDNEGTPALPLLIYLLKYGRAHSEITILEGILRSDVYRELFEVVLAEYGADIFAYYYDIPFEETLKRHETKPQRFEFGEELMREWWREKDYIGFLPEKTITETQSLHDTVEMIYGDVLAAEQK